MRISNCELCQHYSCKVVRIYGLLLLAAVMMYFILVTVLAGGEYKPDKAILATGLLAWTAAMIVPVAAFYAIADGREQQKAMLFANHALKLIEKNEQYGVAINSISAALGIWESKVQD